MGSPYFETRQGKSTMAMMWRRNKLLWGIRKIMIMDRGFFVLKGLIDMYERGVYVISVANKHIY